MRTTLTKFEPKLRIFFSVDVIGSTEYKHNLKEDGIHQWLPFFENFYREFPIIFRAKIEEEETDIKKQDDFYPEIWKSLGDEILFVAELVSHRHASLLIRSFKRSLEDYNKKIIQSDLSVKGTSWIAGFPVYNAELIFDSDKDSKEPKVDYIGPSIDIGFRLSKYSVETKMVISVDLAYLLLKDIENKLVLVFEGRHKLKGVGGDRGYPLIYVIVDAVSPNAAEVEAIGKPDIAKLNIFVKEFLNSKGFNIPFILSDPLVCKKPMEYDKKLKSITEMMNEPSDSIDLPEIPPPDASS